MRDCGFVVYASCVMSHVLSTCYNAVLLYLYSEGLTLSIIL